jgi:hypothetical protein
MSLNHARRLDALAEWTCPKCRTCYGHAFAIVIVPEGEDPTAPEWNPTHCRECGTPLRMHQKIIGNSDAEMYGDDDPDATPEDGN